MTLAERTDQRVGSAEHHRPAYHVRLRRGFLNDPNGPVIVGDTVHLYFQSRPVADLGVPVEWGHVTSPDFVTWTMHRPAMAPVPDGLDRDGCWSGNTVLDGGRVRAFYSGLLRESPYQSVLTAVSDDGGYTFGPPEQVVTDPTADEGVTMYRDPFVWRDGDRWSMVVGAGYADDVAGIRAYTSDDLRTWTRRDDLCSTPRRSADEIDTGAGWECPQVFHLDGEPVAVVGTWSLASGPLHLVAFPADDPSRPTLVDHGTSLYAASALRESPYGPLLFGWVTEDRTPATWARAGWAGALSLPRQVWWEDDSLRSAPVPTVQNLRAGAPRAADGAVVGAQCEITLPTAPAHVRLEFGGGQYLEIVADAEADILRVERNDGFSDASSIGPRTLHAPAAFDAGSDRPAARVFVDGSIVEVFTSAGRVLTTRVYPADPPPWQVRTSAGVTVCDLTAVAPAAQ